MSQAMYTAMTGINAGQETITVVSDNIANLNTTAFKESAINFQDVWYKTYTSGTAPTYSAGGTNSKQVGVGISENTVDVNSIVIKNKDGYNVTANYVIKCELGTLIVVDK